MRVIHVKKIDTKNTPDKNKNSNLFSGKKDSEVGDITFKQILENIEKELKRYANNI